MVGYSVPSQGHDINRADHVFSDHRHHDYSPALALVVSGRLSAIIQSVFVGCDSMLCSCLL